MITMVSFARPPYRHFSGAQIENKMQTPPSSLVGPPCRQNHDVENDIGPDGTIEMAIETTSQQHGARWRCVSQLRRLLVPYTTTSNL